MPDSSSLYCVGRVFLLVLGVWAWIGSGCVRLDPNKRLRNRSPEEPYIEQEYKAECQYTEPDVEIIVQVIHDGVHVLMKDAVYWSLDPSQQRRPTPFAEDN